MTKNENIFNLDYDTFKNIIDNLHDEIMVFDHNFNLIYLNKASNRHYGISPEYFIGKNFADLDNNFWGNSTLPKVYKEKKTVIQRQVTNVGDEIITISVPIFDENQKLKYVVMNVNDISIFKNITPDENNSIDIVYPKQFKSKYIYISEVMKNLMQTIHRISATEFPLLITGETGTGKSYLAKCIHETGPRKNKPFVSINCACLNAELLESELFGYRGGAFSGANKSGKKGLVEIADGGTLFLDEVSEIPFSLQSKFLQLIQEQEFIPLGSEKKVKVDIRIISATNCNLEELVNAKKFRQDLYFRLNAYEVTVPPLRERVDDIQLLLYHFLNHFNKKYHLNHTITKKAVEILKKYTWPGNIRELIHIIEKLSILISDKEITSRHLPKTLFQIKQSDIINNTTSSYDQLMHEYERKIIVEAANKYKSSVQVAKALKISQSKAYRLMKKYLESTIE